MFGTPAGASAVNTITFQGNETDSTKVCLYQTNQVQGSSHMLLPINAQHFIFRKIKFEVNGAAHARVLVTYGTFAANCNLVFENCLFMGSPTVAGTNGALCCINNADDPIKKLVFRNNLFASGSYGIYCDDGLDLSVFEMTGNKFLDQNTMAIYLNNSNGVVVNNNDIHLDNTDANGIELNDCNGYLSVQGNTIYVAIASYDYVRAGIYLNRCNAAGTLARGIIANNMIRVGGVYAIAGIQLDRCTYQGVYNNSVNVINTHTTSAALYAFYGDHNEARNNNFANFGGGYALNSNSTSLPSSDYNNYYTTGEYFEKWGTTDVMWTSSLRTLNSDDAHSSVFHPRFHSPTGLHTNTCWLDGKGIAVSGITTDIDGEARSSPPDIGADEFEPILPLAGVDKIGGDSADYNNIKDAFNDLDVLGVIGPTTFEIRTGKYNEFIGEVYTVYGSDANNTIVFKSESGNPEDVILYYSTNSTNDYIIDLYRQDNISIMDLSIAATGANDGGAIRMTFSGNVNIINNILSLANNTDPVLSINGSYDSDIVIKNNSFIKGSKGIDFFGSAGSLATNTFIIGNTFTETQSHAVHLRYHLAPKVNGNNISNSEYPNFVPIELINCNENLEIIGNIINNSPGDLFCKTKRHGCLSLQHGRYIYPDFQGVPDGRMR